MTVQDIAKVEGFWLFDSQDTVILNTELSTDFDGFFMVEDFGEGDQVVYGIYGIVPLLTKDLHGPFTVDPTRLNG